MDSSGTPRKFAWSVIGHEEALRLLQRLLFSPSHHAFLFLGPTHVGKTTVAQMVTKTLLCQADARSASPPYPCWSCPACTASPAQQESSLTVIRRPEGKNVIPLERIRALQGSLHLRSFAQHPRIILFLEADLLTEEAANALLKLLEEPPPHTRFLLLAELLDGVPATIRSRCHVVNFPPVPITTIASALAERGVPSHEAETVARLSGGLPGRALEIVQLPAKKETMLKDLKNFLTMLTASPQEARQAINAVFSAKEAAGAARERMLQITDSWRTLLHDALLVQCNLEHLTTSAPLVPDIKTFAQRLPKKTLLAAFHRLSVLEERLRRNANPRLAVEAYLLSFSSP